MAFGIHYHDDPSNVISTVAYHDPEGLYDQDLFSKRIEMYLDYDLKRLYTFKEFTELSSYSTRVLLNTLNKVSDRQTKQKSDTLKKKAELEKLISESNARNKGMKNG